MGQGTYMWVGEKSHAVVQLACLLATCSHMDKVIMEVISRGKHA